MPELEYVSGTGALYANHQTCVGAVVYALTVSEAPPGDRAVTGEFAFVAAPLDVSADAQLSLELADGTWLAIDLKYYDPTQNIYTFAGTGRACERGA